MTTTHAAKRMVKRALAEAGYRNRLTAHQVSFMDLHRVASVFVMVHDWDPSLPSLDIKVPSAKVLYITKAS